MADKSNTAPEDKDCWRSPPEIFEPLNERFNFRYDMAAADHNALCARYYTEQNSALGIEWPAAWKWCNPPYSKPLPWFQQAAQYRKTVLLLHLAVATQWIGIARREANTIIQLTERIQFIHARTGERAATKNNRDSQIIIFGRRPNPDGARIVQCSIADIAKYL